MGENKCIMHWPTQAGGFITDRYLSAPASKARLDTMSKAKYGTQLRELGGWPYVQDVLQVGAGFVGGWVRVSGVGAHVLACD